MFRAFTSVVVIAAILLLVVSLANAQSKKPKKMVVEAQPVAVDVVPVNPNASPEARAVLKYLYSISGKYTLTGQHNYPYHIARWTDRAYDLTGKYPALYGEDFGFSGGEDKDSIEARPALVEEVKRQWRNGAVVTLTWHEVRPTDDEPVTFLGSVQKKLTDFEWNELLTPGTDLNKRWVAQVDVVAGFLKQLRDARVPVLFRPYHEMNGNWFWWGYRTGPRGTAQLYRQIYDRLVNVHHLDNLIWLWNVNARSQNAGPFVDYYPGPEYVDVLTVDNYGEFKQEYYDDIVALAKGKPVALGEVGALPDVEVFKTQPRWTYFMTWSEWIEEANAVEKVRAVYNAPMMLGRDDARLSSAMVEIRKATVGTGAEPVTPRAIAPAKTLLTRLQSASGKNLVLGQQNDVRAIAGSAERVAQVTAKSPAIYGIDLSVAKDAGIDPAAGRQAIVEEAKRQFAKGAMISVSWHPTRPTDDEPATWGTSVRGKLTDYEWDQLLKPGTQLHKRWDAQVASIAAPLKQLEDAGIPVLFRPYPELNGNRFWWSGRKGPKGSAALYRQLFNCLTEHHGLKNLIWVWNATPAGSESGPLVDYFPGQLYVDAVSVSVDEVNPWSRADGMLRTVAMGKPIGLEATGKVPDADVFSSQTAWTWLILTQFESEQSGRDEALKKLYAHPRVLALGAGESKPAASAK